MAAVVEQPFVTEVSTVIHKRVAQFRKLRDLSELASSAV